MDIILFIVAILCLLAGFIGCIVPMLPGPPISWVALLLLKVTRFGAVMSWQWIIIFALIVVLVTILDYVIPAWGVKKFGGTRTGAFGATLGLVAGLFFSPIGIIFGPFIGAFIGELITGQSGEHSFRAAFGAFLGFLFGIGMKLIVCAWITVYFFTILF